ncbi:MAG: hypothetical protein ACI9XP_001074, partial [Lentimonas sp.]
MLDESKSLILSRKDGLITWTPKERSTTDKNSQAKASVYTASWWQIDTFVCCC